MSNHTDKFTKIYETHVWNSKDVSNEFKGNSGPGSSLEFNGPYIEFLRDFIEMNHIKTVHDMGCGDWRTGPPIYAGLDVEYTGYDVYRPMVDALQKRYKRVPNWRFEYKDCSKDFATMGSADLLIVKDVLQHWTNQDIYQFLQYLKNSKAYKYVLITNCYCLNLGLLGPFSFLIRPFIEGEGHFRLMDHTSAIFRDIPLELQFTYNTKKVYLWKLK